jgi:hypothetical protein
MDDQELQKKIAEYAGKLPPKAQEEFVRMEWIQTVENIAVKYGLTTLQESSLMTETTLTLLGLVEPEAYEKFLTTDLSVPVAIGQKILADINQSLLNKFRADLTAAYTANVFDAAEEQYGQGMPLDERFDRLPEEVKKTIEESNYQQKLYAIGNRNKLTIEQIGILEKDTTNVLLGIDSPDEYAATLRADLGIQDSQLRSVVEEVNMELLGNIRELLKAHMTSETKLLEAEPANDTEADDTEETPVPPYTQQAPVVSTPQTASNIFGNAGIEVIPQPPAAPETTAKKETAAANLATEEHVLQKSGIDVVEEAPTHKEDFVPTPTSRKEVLSGIENPPVLGSSIIGSRLSGTIVQPIQKSVASAPEAKADHLMTDPYREIPE